MAGKTGEVEVRPLTAMEAAYVAEHFRGAFEEWLVALTRHLTSTPIEVNLDGPNTFAAKPDLTVSVVPRDFAC